MVSLPFQRTAELADGVSLVPSTTEHIAPIVDIMLVSEPWLGYGFERHFLERFVSGSVQAHIMRTVMVDADNPDEAMVAGAVSLHPGFLGGRYIEVLLLAPRLRGKGLGRRIIETLCEEMPSSLRDLYLLVSESNAPAVGFYRRLGFREVGPLPDLMVPGKTEILLWLRFR
ncbi:MAG: GNAT family N-acetyltransferase [Deltaproteobacteria bacterium]|nr:GNAT family N-acetyltransferase [Deltaproteobacteria bacterium]MCB9478703.1 GNAT family N-acetyltransferase [Deltaproteobacteria bacterium]MCB9488219.1 GNAT family N-acetyltransferase [Deltaproteobacteria bacterium]